MKSITTQEFDETAVKASHYCTYAQGALHLCVDPVDKGLGMNDTTVLQTDAAPVTNEYTKFQFETAKESNWVMGLVAMIPCIQVCLLYLISFVIRSPRVAHHCTQSYYALASPLYKNASDEIKRMPN